VHTSYSDRFVDIIGEGFDCAVRIGHLRDSTLIARRIGRISGKLVASPEYIKRHGAPETPDEIVAHEALMQGTESWNLVDGNEVIAVHPRGRFKADNGVALASAAVAGLGIAALPDFLIDDYVNSGALVPLLVRYPFTELGIFLVRPPGQHPSRKVRVLTELLIEHFG
jgi:DNA-binding transcriptional LysR family regulator